MVAGSRPIERVSVGIFEKGKSRHTDINGAIHWKVSRLRKLAPYSLDTVLSLGTGGNFRRFRGFRRLYHDCALLSDFVPLVPVVVVVIDEDVVNALRACGRTCFSLE